MPEYIEEAEVSQLDFPWDSFLSQLITYTESQTEAPTPYALVNGLCALATVAPADLLIENLPGGPFKPLLWGMSIGRPRVERKTTSLRVTQRLLFDARPDRMGNDPFTAAALVKGLESRPIVGFWFREYGAFMDRIANVASAADLQSILLDLFDAPDPFTKELKAKTYTIYGTRVSMCGAVNPGLIEQHSTEADHRSGWFGRWGPIIWSKRERTLDDEVPPDPERRQWLCDWLSGQANDPIGRCEGLTPAAMTLWKEWNHDLDFEMAKSNSEAYIALTSGTPTCTIKMALLMAYDFGPARQGSPWRIDEDIVARAIAIGNMHHRSAVMVSERCHSSRDMQEYHKVLRCVSADPNAPTSYMDILQGCALMKKRVDDLLETAKERGEVAPQSIRGKPNFYRLDPETHQPYEPDCLPTGARDLVNSAELALLPTPNDYCEEEDDRYDETA
ncbi:MAG: hypothetical protein WC869_08335 [Phycisphaerae bacterium]|jgi:hypothetical protein